jgi:hypothetical protein
MLQKVYIANVKKNVRTYNPSSEIKMNQLFLKSFEIENNSSQNKWIVSLDVKDLSWSQTVDWQQRQVFTNAKKFPKPKQ